MARGVGSQSFARQSSGQMFAGAPPRWRTVTTAAGYHCSWLQQQLAPPWRSPVGAASRQLATQGRHISLCRCARAPFRRCREPPARHVVPWRSLPLPSPLPSTLSSRRRLPRSTLLSAAVALTRAAALSDHCTHPRYGGCRSLPAPPRPLSAPARRRQPPTECPASQPSLPPPRPSRARDRARWRPPTALAQIWDSRCVAAATAARRRPGGLTSGETPASPLASHQPEWGGAAPVVLVCRPAPSQAGGGHLNGGWALE